MQNREPSGNDQTPLEEFANALTHGIGGVLSIAGLVVLILIAGVGGGAKEIACVSVYGATLIFMFVCSALYHGVWHIKTKRLLRVFDHCAIYLLIAGTYTPVALLGLPHPMGFRLCAAVWALAALGIVLRLWSGRFRHLRVPLYLAMGWLAVGWIGSILEGLGAGGAYLIIAGGLAYTFGAVFYALPRMPFNHAVWHGFVLGGSACHFFAIALYVLPMAASRDGIFT